MSTSKVFTVGQVLTAALMNDLPQGSLGITRQTADIGPTVGTTELGVITAPPVTIAGSNRRIRISFHARGIDSTVAGDVHQLRIKEGATVLNDSYYVATTGSTTEAKASDFQAIVDSPSVGSHTYSVTIQRIAGTGVATVRGTATAPQLLNVEDIGAVP